VAHILEASQQVLLDQCSEAIAIVDAREIELPLIVANRACRALFADRTAAHSRLTLETLSAQLPGRDLRAALLATIASGEAATWHDVPLQHSSGDPTTDALSFWEWHLQPVRDRDGVIAQIVIMLTDTTPQRSVAHERRLQVQLVEQLPLAFALTAGPDHTVTLANGRLATLLGTARREVIGQPLASTQLGQILPHLGNLLDKTYTDGTPGILEEVPIGRTDAETDYWTVQLRAVPTIDDQVGGVMLLIHDVTGRVRQRTALSGLAEAAEHRADELAAVIGALVDGLLILNHDGTVVRTNTAAEQLLGSTGSLLGRPASALLREAQACHEDGRPCDPDSDLIAPALRGEQRASQPLRFGSAEQGQRERIVAVTAAPVHHDRATPDGAIIVLRDISAQKRTEQEKDSFLSLISHEIKSPLTSIKGFSQLAMRAIEVDDEPLRRATKHLHVIEQQADRIGHLVSDLSDVARLQRDRLILEPTVFDLTAGTRTVIEQQAQAIRTHRIEVTMPDEPLIVRADPRRVQQIIANLLTNAAKYSPQADTIGVSLTQHGDHARLAVRDWGIGIPADEQPRIFDRFFRAAGGGASGLGLGLFIAHQIAAKSGGSLTVESKESQGSTFCLALPLARPGEDDD
jgi:signal transduction histidine kinase